MSDRPVPLFFNPTAGRGRAGRRAASLGALLDANGIAHVPVATRAPGHMEELVAAAIHDGHTRLLVAGGDGTVHEAVNGILGSGGQADLGVIPIGTGNDFAKACSIPPFWEDATMLLADRLVSGAPARPIDAGRFNDRYFVNGAGIGFDARVSRIAAGIRLPVGDLVYLLGVLRALWDGVATPEITIRFDGRTITGPLTLANIGNGSWVGGMFNIAPMARNDDGQLDLVYAAPMTRRRVMMLLPKLMQGRHLERSEVSWFPMTRCEIESAEPVPSQLDGEVQPLQSSFRIEILSGALHLL